MVDDKGAWFKSFQFAGERDLDEELEVAQDDADDGEAVEDGHGDGPFAVDADIEGAIATLVKAVVAIAMIRKDDNVVSALLQPNRRINNQALSAANAQIRMKEDNCAVWRRLCVCL